MSKLSDSLKAELMRRIRQDMLPLNKWNPKTWMTTTFGLFYGPDVIVIHRLVGECVDNVLKGFNEKMTNASWARLQAFVNAADTPETALPDMERSALVTEPRFTSFELFLATKPAKKKPAKKKAHAKKVKKESPKNG